MSPFKSKAQARFLFAKHPKIAERWAREGHGWKGLRERARKMLKRKKK